MRNRTQLAAVLLALSSVAAAQQAPPFSAADMLDIVEFARGGEPVIAPTGDLVAYVAVDVGPDSNVRAARPTGHLWVVAANGADPRRLTAPDERGDAPVWSPDGKQLAYIQTRGSTARIAVWDRASARARLVGPSLGDDRASLPLLSASIHPPALHKSSDLANRLHPFSHAPTISNSRSSSMK